MKTVVRIFAFILVIGMASEIIKIHRHIHVLECAVRGEITDTDFTRWSPGDEVCEQLKRPESPSHLEVN